MAKVSDNAFPSILITEGTEPAAPAAGKQRLYIDSTTHHLKRTDSSGADVDIESAAGTPGAWTSYTPTLVNLTLGNGTLAAAYRQNGKDVEVRIQFTFGSTSAITGTCTFTAPVAEKSGVVQALAAAVFDTSAGQLFPGSATVGAAAGLIHAMSTGGTAVTTGTLAAGKPVTYATGDYIAITGIYEAN